MAEPVPLHASRVHDPVFPENSPTSAPHPPFVVTDTDVSPAQYWWEIESKMRKAGSRLKQAVTLQSSEHPLQVVLGVAVVAFAVGIGLRLWRVRHD